MFKAGTLRGCLVNIQNLILKGLEPPLPFICCVSELERKLEEIKREREKKKIGGGCVKIKCLDHPLLTKVCDVIPCSTSC